MDQDLNQKLDQIIVELRQLNYVNRRNIVRKFFLGIAQAFGATVGLAVVIALLGALIKALGGLPLIGSFLITFGRFIK